MNRFVNPIFLRLLIMNAIAFGVLGLLVSAPGVSDVIASKVGDPGTARFVNTVGVAAVSLSIAFLGVVPRFVRSWDYDSEGLDTLANTGFYIISFAFVAGLSFDLFISQSAPPKESPNIIEPRKTEFQYILFFIIALVGVGIFLAYYLSRPGRSGQSSGTDDFRESLSLILQQLRETRRTGINAADLQSEIGKIQKQIADLGTSKQPDITSEDRASIVQMVVRKIDETINDEFIRAIDAKYSSAIQEAAVAKGLLEQFERLQSRLLRAIEYLEQRANVNLIIGILTTLGAVGGLFYIVFIGTRQSFESAQDVFVHYIRRVSFVIFIEIFSYFFLRLYKVNVEDVKYYHNELTNVDSKLIALRAALLIDDANTIKAMAGTLGKTERNYILRRGETTTEIERFKLEGKGASELLKQLTEIFKLSGKR